MFRENQRHGLILTDGAGGHRIEGTTCLWNSLAGQGLYDGINADNCPSIHITSNDSNDFYYASAGYPVCGVSRQRYGFKANNCPNIITDGANCFTPNFTGTVLLTGTSTWASGDLGSAISILTDAATIAVDSSLANEYKVTLAGNRIVGAPTNPASGQRIEIVVVQDVTGGRTLAWNAVFKTAWSDVGNAANKRSSIVFAYDGTNWNQIGAQSPYV